MKLEVQQQINGEGWTSNWCGKFTLPFCVFMGLPWCWCRCKKVVTNHRRNPTTWGGALCQCTCIYMHEYLRCWRVGLHARAYANGVHPGTSFPFNPTHLAWTHRLSLKDECSLRCAVLTLMQTLVILSPFGLQSCSWSVCGGCVLRQQAHILNR